MRHINIPGTLIALVSAIAIGLLVRMFANHELADSTIISLFIGTLALPQVVHTTYQRQRETISILTGASWGIITFYTLWMNLQLNVIQWLLIGTTVLAGSILPLYYGRR